MYPTLPQLADGLARTGSIGNPRTAVYARIVLAETGPTTGRQWYTWLLINELAQEWVAANDIPLRVTPPPADCPHTLRVWPALILLGLLVVARISPYLAQEMSFGLFMFAVNAPFVAGVGILVWWMFGSRAAGRERWLGPLAVLAIAAVCYVLLDPSLKGMGFFFYVVPTGVAASA